MNRNQADKLHRLKQNLISANEDAFFSERYDNSEEAKQHNMKLIEAVKWAEKELIDYQATLM